MAQDGNEDKWKWLPVVRTGSPPTKERYCSMVSFGGVDTGKSNNQREREVKREFITFYNEIESKLRIKKDENRNRNRME